MGIESLLQQNLQNTGPTEKGDSGRFDFMNKGMYPMSQLQRSNYANPTQVPLGAQAIMADYDPATNPLTGEPVSRFNNGGIAAIRFEKGGKSVFKDDPNNFAADITKAYTTLFGRDPSEQELRANVDALNKDPDSYAFVVRKLAESPEVDKAVEEGKVSLAPRTVMSDEGEVEVPAKDAAVTDLLGGYGKWKPQPRQGGIGGFYNNNPLVALPLTAAAIMAPEVIPALMESGAGVTIGAPIAEPALGITAIAPEAGAIPLSEITGSTFAGPAFTLPESLATATAVGAGEAAINPATGLPWEATGSGYAGGAGAVEAAEKGITAKQAMGAKMALDMATKVGESAFTSPYGTGPSSTTTPLIFNPNANRISTPGISPMGTGQQYGQLYDTKANTYKYYAQGGITNLARGGSTNLGSYSDGGHLLKGPGDGMSDNIPATIGGKQPARLADGEFVIPADVVSHLGNGSTDAGAKQLYKMMDRIRKARTGRKQQGKKINPDKYMIKG